MTDEIVAVTGSGRSGTSLMMQMLSAGGLPAYADRQAQPYECARTLMLAHDHAWLPECYGHALKVLEPLHIKPFPRAPWRFILMQRNPVEQAKSQRKWLTMVANENVPKTAVARIANGLRADLPKMRALLQRYGPVLDVSFEELLAHPMETATAIAEFVPVPLDVERMAAQVLRRSPACHPGLLELEFARQ